MTDTDLDVVVHDAVVLTVDERNRIYERGTILVEDGRIAAVRSTREGDADLPARRVIDGEGTLAMPGLVNAHTHLEMTPLFGACSDLSLRKLMEQMTVLVDQLAEDDLAYFRRAGYELAALNFLSGGVTTVNSMDVRPARGVETFGEAGLRGIFGPATTDLFWDRPVDEQFERAREFIEQYHGSYDGRIRAAICPHDDWSCTRELWERTAQLAEEYPDVPVHTHLLELDESDRMARSNGAADSLDLLEEVGLLNERLVGAHYRVADERDVRRTARAGAGVAHCPSVFAHWNPDPDAQWTPVPALRSAGVDVGVGIDDHYWHDSYDLFGEARQTRLSANLERGTGQFRSIELVRMLTVEGARAVGMGEEVGSLEPGKRADLILLDVDEPKFTPLTNVPAQVAGNATAGDVQTVLVDGEVLMDDGQVLTMDVEAVRERARDALDRFEAETDWEFGLGGSDPPSTTDFLREVPKRGPVRLLARLAAQSAKDTVDQRLPL